MIVKINGKEILPRTVMVVRKSFEIVNDVVNFLGSMFHGSIELAIKIGLLVFLYPYILKFCMAFIKLIQEAGVL